MTRVVVSVGSNIDRQQNIRRALNELRAACGQLEVSPVYETTAVGFTGPPFFNLVVGFDTEQSVEAVLALLQQIECNSGRRSQPKSFDSRRLDLDMLLYGHHNLRADGLNVPRDEIEKYAYVLKPLADLYPNAVHPLLGVTFAEMWESFDAAEQNVELVLSF